MNALVHSRHDKSKDLITATRLSWLGDAFLHQVVSDDLFHRHPKWTKHQLHTKRKNLTNNRMLGLLGEKLGVDEAADIDPSLLENLKDRDHHKMLAGMLEGVVGAIYLDGGLNEARRVILQIWDGPLRVRTLDY